MGQKVSKVPAKITNNVPLASNINLINRVQKVQLPIDYSNAPASPKAKIPAQTNTMANVFENDKEIRQFFNVKKFDDLPSDLKSKWNERDFSLLRDRFTLL